MPRRRVSISPQTNFGVLAERIANHDALINILRQSKMSHVQVIDIENFNEPAESMTCIDWPTGRFCWYHDNEWICTPDSLSHAIKVFSDKKATKVGDGAFRFSIDPKLDGKELIYAGGFLGTAGSGSTILQISNQTRGVDLLTTRITIPGGGYDDLTNAVVTTAGPVTLPNRRMVLKDRIWIDVDAIGSGGKGLGVYLYFDFPRIEPSV